MRGPFAACFVLMLLAGGASPVEAQPPGPEQCEDRADARGVQWATSEHNWLSNVWETEMREISLDWCRLLNATGKPQQVDQAENVARVVLTGEGIHPTVGTPAPNSGLGGGLALNLERASKVHPLRFDGHGEVRGSTSGSWATGATLNIRGSGDGRVTGHAYGSIEAEHVVATQRAFFGASPAGSPIETRYRLSQTTARGVYHSPERGGASLFGEAGLADFRPEAASNSSLPTIGAVFSDTVAPGLSSATTYVVWGGGLNWRRPVDDQLAGYSTQLSASLRSYQASGDPYSFQRADVTWAQQYTLDTSADFGTLSTTARLVTSTARSGSRVPFYLQPTLGGTDIEHEGGLRSYSYDRFRAADLLVLQAEYTKTVFGPVAFLGFMDLGQVMSSLSAMDSSDWHHSEGIGLTFRAGNVAYFRIFYAWGGSEGSRFGATGDSNHIALDGAKRGVF